VESRRRDGAHLRTQPPFPPPFIPPPSLPSSLPSSLPPSLPSSLPVLTHPLSVNLQPQAPLSLAVQRTILSREDEAEEVLRKGGRAEGRDRGKGGGRQEGTFQGEKGGAQRGNVTRMER
jgi:hypothetical protein